MEAMSNHSSPTQFTHNCNTMHIKYIKKGGAVKQGTKLLDNIDEAIKLAYAVANHYKCYTRIARV